MKQENNTEFVQRLMTEGCPTGGLVQAFVLQALEAYAMTDADYDEDGPQPIKIEPPESLLVHMPVGMARAFAIRTLEVVPSVSTLGKAPGRS